MGRRFTGLPCEITDVKSPSSLADLLTCQGLQFGDVEDLSNAL